MKYFLKVDDFQLSDAENTNKYKATAVHQYAYQPETKESLENLENALTEQDSKEGKHLKKK